MLVRHRTLYPSLVPSFDRPFDRPFDRAFEQLTSSFFDTSRTIGPVIDGAWVDDRYVLTVDLPGVPADAVTVEVTGTTLTVGATTDSLDWQRSVRLGGRLDPEKVDARHVDGRLTVRIGTIDEPEARTIAVETASPDLAIEASSHDSGDDQAGDDQAGDDQAGDDQAGDDQPGDDQPRETNATE
jgi:HSP20 family molecular chaperone IbpA